MHFSYEIDGKRKYLTLDAASKEITPLLKPAKTRKWAALNIKVPTSLCPHTAEVLFVQPW